MTITRRDLLIRDAALDLYAALKHAVAVDAEWRRENGEPIRTPEYQESYDRVIAAIAKAEGR